MGSRFPLVFLLAILLGGLAGPLAEAGHGYSYDGEDGAGRRFRTVQRLLYESYCDSVAGGPPSAISMRYLDTAGQERTWYWHPEAPAGLAPNPTRGKFCHAANQTKFRHWNATETVAPLKPGDRYKIYARFLGIPGSLSVCGPGGVGAFSPRYAARLSSDVLGLNNNTLLLLGGDTVTQEIRNPDDPDGWWTVPEPGTTVRGVTVPEFDRASASDPIRKLDLLLTALWVCNTAPPGAPPVWETYHATWNHVHIGADNTKPIVYVRSSHAVLPAGATTDSQVQPLDPRSIAMGSALGSNDIFYGTPNATVRSTVTFTITICDRDFDPATYSVNVDFRSINATAIATEQQKTQWNRSFVASSALSLCRPLGAAVGQTGPGWVMTKSIVVGEGRIDKFVNSTAASFDYQGITVHVTDDAKPPWSLGTGNLRSVPVALNVDAVRPLNVQTLTATPVAGGKVRLAWDLPFVGRANNSAMHDLRRIEVTYGLAEGSGVPVRTIAVVNGTHLVNAASHGSAPCAATAPSGAGAARWGNAQGPPSCLLLPDALVAPDALLAATGESRRYFFTVATRDDADSILGDSDPGGNAPSTLPTVYARVDGRPPVITPLTLPAEGGHGKLPRVAVTTADESGVASVTVSIQNRTTLRYWNGATWATGSEVKIPLLASGTGHAVTTALLGDGGSLAVRVYARDVAGNEAVLERNFTHDASAPVLTMTHQGTVPQNSSIALQIGASDAVSGVRVLNLTILDGTAVARAVTWCVGSCPAGATGTVIPSAPSWTLPVDTTGLAVRKYAVRVDASDNAWNRATVSRSENLTVAPRATILVRHDTPFLTGRNLTIEVAAGYSEGRDATGALCPSGVCPPDVALDYQSSTGGWTAVKATPRRAASTPTAQGTYRYILTGDDIGQSFEVLILRARAIAPNATFATPPVEAKTPASQGATFLAPIPQWAPSRWLMTATPAGVTIAWTLAPPASEAVAMRARLTPTNPAGAPVWSAVTPDGNGVYSLALGDRASGEYELVACPVAASAASKPLASLVAADCIYPSFRYVGVEKTPITMTLRVNGQEPASATWGGRLLTIEGTVHTGYANVTLDNFTITLAPRAGATFRAFTALREEVELLTSDPAAKSYRFQTRVRLSDLARFGTTRVPFHVTLGVTPDIGPALSYARDLTYDPGMPEASLIDPGEGPPARFLGRALDEDSGVRRLNVTLVRDDGRSWNGSAWVLGEPREVPVDYAPASCRAQFLPDAGSVPGCDWWWNVSGAIPASETGRAYTITLVATDGAGNSAPIGLEPLRFDRTAPQVTILGVRPGRVPALGTVEVEVRATDALSGVTTVEAVLERYGGAPTSIPLSRGEGTANDGRWSGVLAGSRIPYVGSYNLSFRAVDGATRVGTAIAPVLVVTDDGPVVFDTLTATPNPTEAWRGVSFTAVLAERDRVEYLRVNLTRDGEASGWISLVPTSVDPVTRAGTWTLSTHGKFNLTRGATYTATFAAKDPSNAEVTKTLTFSVAANDRPRIRTLLTPLGGQYWVKPEPTIVWEIDDENARPDNLYVTVTVDGLERNLTTSLSTSARSDGVRASLAVSPALRPGGTVTLRLWVIDPLGAFNETVVNATVDASSPSVLLDAYDAVRVGTTHYATPATRLNATAVDGGSGVVSLERRFGNGSWEPITGNFTLGAWPNLTAGNVSVVARAVDAAGNVAEANLTLVVDKTAPVLTPAVVDRTVRIRVNETGIGVAPASVRVSVRDGATGVLRNGTLVRNATSGLWEMRLDAAIFGRFFYSVNATDLAGNRGSLSERVGFTHNLAPTLALRGIADASEPRGAADPASTVANGTSVRGKVEIRFDAFDPEGRVVNVTARIRGPDGKLVLVGSTEGSSILWSTASLPDGEVVLVLNATDGSASTVLERRLKIRNLLAAAVESPVPSSVAAGGAIGVTLVPNGALPVRSVTAVVERQGPNGTWVPAIVPKPLQARDGRFAFEYAPETPGTYRILLLVAYDDVVGMDTVTAGEFTVQGAGAKPTNILVSPVFLAMAAVVVALIAAGAAVAWRMRK